jgi:hypothetical protein
MERSTSALGQKQTWQRILMMSDLPPKADIGTQSRNVCFVPEADSCTAAKNVDPLVCACEQLQV